MDDYKPGRTFGGKIKGILQSPLRSDGKRLVLKDDNDGGFVLWDTGTGRRIAAIPKRAIMAGFGIKSEVLLSVEGAFPYGIRLYDSDAGKEIGFMASGDRRTTRAALSPNGQFVAAASQTGQGTQGGIHTVTIFDSETGIPLIQLFGHENFIADAVFSPDNRLIATIDDNGETRIFTCEACVSGSDLYNYANDILARKITPLEKRLNFD
jgi:WD40 repeat protein